MNEGDRMPEQPTQARRFRKARFDRSTIQREDYVELIDDLVSAQGEARATDVARRLGVAHPTAVRTIARLRKDGLVASRPYQGITLTAAGRALAERGRARHRLVVALLVGVGVAPDVAEVDAEGMEHHASEASLAAFARFLARRA